MFACPHCQALSISSWRKANASSTFPAKCPSCRGRSFVSGWAHAATILFLEVLLWGTVIAAFVARSWLMLLLIPIGGLLWSLLIGVTFNLKPIDGPAVYRARRNAAIQVGAFLLVVLWRECF